MIEATKKHREVVAFFLYKKSKYEGQEAQKWWVSKSLIEFKNKLIGYNINLEIISIESYKSFFEKLFKKKNFSIYWNRTYEPNYLKFDRFLSENFKKNNLEFNIFKGNILNEFHEVKKNDGTPFKVFTPFGEAQKNITFEKIPLKKKNL